MDTLKLDLIGAGDLLEAVRPGFEGGGYQPPLHCRNISAGQCGSGPSIRGGWAGRTGRATATRTNRMFSAALSVIAGLAVGIVYGP